MQALEPIYATTLPPFGISGKYSGSLEYDSQDYNASLKVLHASDDIVRGIISTEIPYVDEFGDEYVGTDLFFKGGIDENLIIEMKISRHQCSYLADICARTKDPITVGNVQFTEIGSTRNGPLYQAIFSFRDQDPNAPFSAATLSMEETLSTSSDVSNPYWGNWFLEGYGARNIIYAGMPPAFDAAYLTLFENNGGAGRNIFTYELGEWHPSNRIYGLYNASPGQHSVTLSRLWWFFELSFDNGYASGLIRGEGQSSMEIDFEGLLLGVYSRE